MKDFDYNVSDPKVRVNLEIIQKSVSALETGKANISSSTGAPGGGGHNDLYIDNGANRLYVNVNGVWKYTVLI